MTEAQATQQEPKLTKKQLKAAAFKAKKGKAATDKTTSDTPQDADQAPTREDASSATPSFEKPQKRSKKRKAAETEVEKEAEVEAGPTEAQEQKPESSASPKKSKAKGKDKDKKKNNETATAAKKTTFGDDGEVAEEQRVDVAAEEEAQEDAKKTKLIVFVGNMSFTTTADEIAKHFGHTCGETPSVRLLTTKGDPKALEALPKSKQKSIAKGKALDPSKPRSKGCAFVEFTSQSALRKALLFHHTQFGGRQINVELTAGGGGKSEKRMQKIKDKNAALEKDRKKKHEKYVAPANAAHKAEQAEKAARGEGGPPKKKVRQDGEGDAQWGPRAGQAPASRPARMPRFMASGSNAVRLSQV